MRGLAVPALEALRTESIATLASASGPCISVFLPGYHPGAQAKSMASLLGIYCNEAASQLQDRGISASQIVELLHPLEELVGSPEFARGSHSGRAIFRAVGVFAKLDGIEPLSGGATVGGCFYLRPMLADLHLPRQFHLLKLSKKQVELLTCADFSGEPTDLPKGVPRTLDEAMAFKAPDHDLENRSSAGSSTGSMHAVRFGTGSGRETEQVHVADFFKAVDRGVRELERGEDVSLVLAGVEEDTALYRAVSKHKSLLSQTIAGSAQKRFGNDQLVRRAYAILKADLIERAAAMLVHLRKGIVPARFSADLDAILRASVEGRVGGLFINEGAREFGVFESVRRGGRVNWGQEDLLNVAAVETFLHGGVVYSLPAERMPGSASAVAIFRY
jgi:Bacterial archaeo-eukaryotic release factor family 3